MRPGAIPASVPCEAIYSRSWRGVIQVTAPCRYCDRLVADQRLGDLPVHSIRYQV
jgi:hypothetical protein